MKRFKKIIDLSFLVFKQTFVHFNLIFFVFFSENYAHKQILKLRGSLHLKQFILNYFIKKFKEYPYFYWERYKLEKQLGKHNYNDYLSTYSKKRKEWLKKNLNKLHDTDFVEELVVTGSFGNIYYLYIYLLANLHKLKKQRKTLIYYKNKITNKALFEYFKDHLTIIKDLKIISDDELIVHKLSSHLGSAQEINETFLTPAAATNIILRKNNEQPIKLFSLTDQHKTEGEKFLKYFGLKTNNWFVTLHVRENTYRLFESTEKFRNASISDYLPAIRKINEAGGFVFRVGHSGMKPIPKIDGVYDYANSKKKTELLDVFLGASSKFCIATSSGFYIIPSIFSVPVLMTNCPQHSVFFELNHFDLYLPRLFKTINTDEFIKLPKMFQNSYNSLFSDKMYTKKNLKVIKNSKDEIELATKEMMNNLDNSTKKKPYTNLQNKVNNLIEIEQNKNGENLVPISKISNSFLEKYKKLI